MIYVLETLYITSQATNAVLNNVVVVAEAARRAMPLKKSFFLVCFGTPTEVLTVVLFMTRVLLVYWHAKNT